MWQQPTPKYYDVFERKPWGALPSALKWTKAPSNAYCNYEAPVVWSFDSLCHLTVTCILTIKGHMCLRYFRLVLLNKRSHYGDLVNEFPFILYKFLCFDVVKHAQKNSSFLSSKRLFVSYASKPQPKPYLVTYTWCHHHVDTERYLSLSPTWELWVKKDRLLSS